jgi:retron-type reverse transcriptase
VCVTATETIRPAESYRWSPARRVYTEKKGSTRKRPLSMPSWPDKLVAEVVRMILDAYYDVRFPEYSRGFRLGRGCHTALGEVTRAWTGTRWFIEGDIAGCSGTLGRSVMVSTLAGHVHDGRFLRLIGRMLPAGYLEDFTWHAALSSAPQGGIASPVLLNVYLDRLDQHAEQTLIPEYGRGGRRRKNPACHRTWRGIEQARQRGRHGL